MPGREIVPGFFMVDRDRLKEAVTFVAYQAVPKVSPAGLQACRVLLFSDCIFNAGPKCTRPVDCDASVVYPPCIFRRAGVGPAFWQNEIEFHE
jgi:hypothetical protein